MRRPRHAAFAVASAVGLLTAVAPALHAQVATGTPAQVAALVAAAPLIKVLPSNLDPPISKASNDDPLTEYPSLEPCVTGLTTEPACVFGDKRASRTMVLFGDSHAYMWFPAIDLIAKAAHWRLVALMSFGCPFADVATWNIVTNGPNTTCGGYRSHMIARINALHPRLVIVSEGFYTLNAQDQPITDAQWTTALEASFAALHGAHLKKVLIGNTYLVPNPVACLASYPTAVQTCSKPEANATYTAQRAAEKAAATAQKVTYVNEIPWTCSATCTTVVGSYVVYNSAGHLTATYATYLSGVMAIALKSSMR